MRTVHCQNGARGDEQFDSRNTRSRARRAESSFQPISFMQFERSILRLSRREVRTPILASGHGVWGDLRLGPRCTTLGRLVTRSSRIRPSYRGGFGRFGCPFDSDRSANRLGGKSETVLQFAFAVFTAIWASGIRNYVDSARRFECRVDWRLQTSSRSLSTDARSRRARTRSGIDRPRGFEGSAGVSRHLYLGKLLSADNRPKQPPLRKDQPLPNRPSPRPTRDNQPLQPRQPYPPLSPRPNPGKQDK